MDNNKFFFGKINTIILQIIAIVGLNIAYVSVISKRFSYMGFTYEFDFSKFAIVNFLFLVLLFFSIFIQDKFIYACWHVIFLIYFVGEGIYYQYSIYTNKNQIISIGLILVLLIPISFINFQFEKKISLEKTDTIMSYMSFVMIIPFVVYYYKYIDLKNLFLINVYETRALFRTVSKPLTGYLMSPLARIILPILILNNLELKKYKKVFLYVAMIFYVYLCGALKSVFFGILALFLFYQGTYAKKINRFIFTIIFFTFIGTFVAICFDNVFLLDSFIRRVFFIPPKLNVTYNDFFAGTPTYMTHSGLFLGQNPFGKDLSFFIGEDVLGLQGFNANVGIYTEGFISFGYIGIFLFALLIVFILLFLKMCNIPSKYFGITFVYLYYFNTAFISTLLLTHGLFFFLIVSFLFLQSDKKRLGYE